MKNLQQVAEHFIARGEVKTVHEYGNGNINDTYLVEISGGTEDKFVLQRINTVVFSQPELIIQNLRTLTEHIKERLAQDEVENDRRWEIPAVRETIFGEDYYIDSEGDFWRGISFIDNACSFDTAQHHDHAFQAGYALGRFHNLISDLDINKMHDTLLDFHITPQYLRKYDEVKDRHVNGEDSPQFRYCHQIIESHRYKISVLETAKENGELKTRVIHGDPKINNFMICNQTGLAVSVVDLDTVKPGLVHYDIGDCLRSACNPLGEETRDIDRVNFDIELAKSILEGYLNVACRFLSRNDYIFLYDAIWLIPFELGLRFFTDYLAGNIYFKVTHPKHNLERAMVQFKLTESIETQEGVIHDMISNIMTDIITQTIDEVVQNLFPK